MKTFKKDKRRDDWSGTMKTGRRGETNPTTTNKEASPPPLLGYALLSTQRGLGSFTGYPQLLSSNAFKSNTRPKKKRTRTTRKALPGGKREREREHGRES